MKHLRTLLPYLLVALTSAGLVSAFTRTEAATDPAARAQLEDLDAQLDRLSARVWRQQNQPQDMPRPRGAAGPAPAQAAVEVAEEEVSTAAEPDITAEERETRFFASLDERLGREGRDHDWSIEAEGAIVDTLETMPGTTLHTARCQATMCRVEVSFEDPASQELFLDSAPTRPPFDTRGTMRVTETELGGEATIYIARAGYESEVFDEAG